MTMERIAVAETAPPTTGGAALAEMLRRHGVGPMFGMGGFQLLPFYEGVRARGLNHILINDERCGAFAADAYARVTNRPGICDGTLGPGATNLVTGLIESLNGGLPQVVLVGDSNRAHSWKNMTQEARQVEILRPAAKELIRIEMPERIPELVRRAFAVATAGRPGPVILDVPEDVCHAECAYEEADLWVDAATAKVPGRRSRPAPADVESAASLLSVAARPIILAGGGVHLSMAHDALLRLAERHRIPVAHTMGGKGAIPCIHPLSAGLFGRYSRIANEMIEQADVLLVVGCKLGEIATKRFQLIPGNAKIIHVDILAEELGRTTRADACLVGDARLALEDIDQALDNTSPKERDEHAKEVPVRMAKWVEASAARLGSCERPINVGRLMTEINRALPDDGILVADGGFAGHWGGLLFDTRMAGRHFVPDRGFASIGYGIPGSLGAQVAAPDRRVVGLTGDGGTNMSVGELETARRVGAPFVLCVVNNAASGYVKALQHAMYGQGGYQSSDLKELDYAAIGRAFGCHGIRVEDPERLQAALAEGFENTDSPTIIDVVVTRDPGQMLPAADSRTLKVERGDRPV
jgi:acetolactate synthase-1/2/3 large subunit